MSLHSLDELIVGLGIEPDKEDLDLLLAAFQRDFVDNPFTINNLNVKVIIKNAYVEGYEGYPETFVHLITRKSGSGHRVFDRNRANRIHWIRRILENREEEDVLYFQHLEGNGSVRDYYWYETEDFLVIMEEVTPIYLIITSFYIDDDRNRRYYMGKYQAYLKNGV
tara:strand:+ start:3892 stop:4389 length:498 start_codon:yes stop_codon:yes gene_type:complete